VTEEEVERLLVDVRQGLRVLRVYCDLLQWQLEVVQKRMQK